MDQKDRLIVALDVDTEQKASRLVDVLKGTIKAFKVGSQLFTSCGPNIINLINQKGCRVFLDLKLHDIPNTVAGVATAITRLNVFMFNLHALGGYEMMKQAVAAVDKEAASSNINRPKILAVTILTSMDENSLKKIGIDDNMKNQVLRLASLAKEAGLDGVVASPEEALLIRRHLGKEFLIVTPGVRPPWAAAADQRRIAAPKAAIEAGSDFIVVGRPIIEAPDPAEAAKKILKEI